ncbi:MAG: hypothetical protein GOMPHAMPRED_003151 [Gomphillus americanus]|uniref:Guanyl-nucleotide exchange factor n=1 Tax=Gomphillus americanus TaxID=1940652 RepID=A0A8H3EE06_9LECA|nr:MAG: hypothetical protein GOMPHAMPRED_003151 [Gomphillus americanus]
MPPWSRNRVGKASEKDLKKKAKAQDARPTTPSVPIARAQDDGADSVQSSPRRTRGIRDSVVSLNDVNDLPPSSSHHPSLLEIPETIGVPRNKRFSLVKLRHASDSQLSRTAKQHADGIPPVPQFTPPRIIATAPTSDNLTASKRRSTLLFTRRPKGGAVKTLFSPDADGVEHVEVSQGTLSGEPPPYGDESASSLALPVNRVSESDASSGEHGVFATTTTTHTVSTTTTFFKLPRKKRDKRPLFPLPAKPISANASLGGTPRLSTAEGGGNSPGGHYLGSHPDQSKDGGSPRKSRIFGLGAIERSSSRGSQRSARPSSTLTRGSGFDTRARSATMVAAQRRDFLHDDWAMPTPPLAQSTRTSTSTAGRPSIAGIFNLSKLRQSSEPLGRNSHGGPDTPGSYDSRAEYRFPAVVIPERQEGDTAAKYLVRLEEVVHRSALVAIISKTDGEFMKSVLRSFMRRFSFFEDPLDMAVRKLLMHVSLPKETQQIDRTLQAFADRYNECNPGIFPDADHAYFCAFSIVILHTDAFNKNNKRKMQKVDYTKNAREQSGVSAEVLECFYDNIVYTPFIHLEDDITIPKQQIQGGKSNKKGHKGPLTPSKKHSSGPIDPYTLILDGKLSDLRPDLNEILTMQDPFNFTGTIPSINVAELNRTFLKFGVLQVLSSRSRPGAFMHQATIVNPAEAQVGVVDMKITKVGILWRKDPKKKKTRSPWQEWGAVLTPSQLYLFRNTSWVKTLMHQYDTHSRSRAGTVVIFKPPLEQFRPDFSLPMDEVVALVDSEYKKHKNAFFFTRSTSFQEVFLADNEAELNDWISRINFAATYRTAGVRMRAVIGAESLVQSPLRPESRPSSDIKDDASLKLPVTRLRNDPNLTLQVMEARTQIIQSRLKEALHQKETLEKSIQTLLRLARQLRVLTPIQDKTRESIIDGTIRLASNIRWMRIEYWRVQCHHDILQADFDLDKTNVEDSAVINIAADSNQPTTREEKNRLSFARLNSRSRPPQQPNGRQLFSMDDIFRSPSRTRQSQHSTKGSWELPPLNFDRGRSVSSDRTSRRSSDVTMNRMSSQRSDLVHAASNTARSVAADSDSIDDDHQVLVDAGIILADARALGNDIKSEAEAEDTAKIPELDDKETSKIRHSLQGKLHKAHIPTPSRNKKHRESITSSTTSEDSSTIDGSEGLVRGPGKFTVHGKQASVVNIGADWAGISPEERIRGRQSRHEDELSTSSGLVGNVSAILDEVAGRSRASSSHSTIRDDSKDFITPTEQRFPDDVLPTNSSTTNQSESPQEQYFEANQQATNGQVKTDAIGGSADVDSDVHKDEE